MLLFQINVVLLNLPLIKKSWGKNVLQFPQKILAAQMLGQETSFKNKNIF